VAIESTAFRLGSAAARSRPARRRGPGRPAEHCAAELRDLYLGTALATFLEKGYDGASIEEIARRAGASKMTLYRLYESKEGLFCRVVDLAIARACRSLRVELGQFDSVREGLRELVRQLYVTFTDDTWLSVSRLVIAEKKRFPALARQLVSRERELMSPVERFLEQANLRGLLVIADARAAAYQLAALASGGVRFLIHEPRRGRVASRAWIDAIDEFAWRAWRPGSSRVIA
jgi:AcrR family transcriptional regulator